MMIPEENAYVNDVAEVEYMFTPHPVLVITRIIYHYV